MKDKVFDFRFFLGKPIPSYMKIKKHTESRIDNPSPLDGLKPPEEEVESRKRPLHGVNSTEQMTCKSTNGKRNCIRLKLK